MEKLHDEVVKGQIVPSLLEFKKEPYKFMTNLPDLPQIYIDDVLSRSITDFGYLPPERANRTPIIDRNSLFDNTKFIKECNKHFGYTAATILRFDPMSVLDWHADYPRQCGMNILINDVDGMARTFMREQIEGWNYKMVEVKYTVGKPILINTTVQHTTYNFHPTKTRYVLSISFGKDATYDEVKEYLTKFSDYN